MPPWATEWRDGSIPLIRVLAPLRKLPLAAEQVPPESRHALSDAEKLALGRGALVAVLVLVAFGEIWHGVQLWCDAQRPGRSPFELVGYAANASTVLVNITGLWFLAMGFWVGFRNVLAIVVQWVVAALENARRQTAGIAVVPRIPRVSFGSALAALGALLFARKAQPTTAVPRASPNQTRTRQSQWGRFVAVAILIFALGTGAFLLVHDIFYAATPVARQSVQPPAPAPTPPPPKTLPQGCNVAGAGVECTLAKGGSLDALGTVLCGPRDGGWGIVVWRLNRAGVPFDDRHIPPDTKLAMPACS